MFKTPVVFLIFNRPEQTETVFEVIARAKPAKLFVVADGPRFPEEAQACEKTRDIIKRVDWDCEVITNYSEINLGCKNRVSSGLDWVFSQVEEAIILEDDCLPSPTFFSFCEELLERYREETRIMHIGGVNFQFGRERSNYSYYFSKYCHVWGWATWRRAWKHYDVGINTWPEVKEQNSFSKYFENNREKRYWSKLFDGVFQNKIDTWDFQWVYNCWYQNGVAIIPNTNLVTNIGFGNNATHTKKADRTANIPLGNITRISHPKELITNKEADLYTSRNFYEGSTITYISKLPGRVLYKLKTRLIKKNRPRATA